MNILSTAKGVDNHRRPEFRFCRFGATGLDFGRPRPGRSWWSPYCLFTASKINRAIVQPFASAISDHAAQTSGGWIMFLRWVICVPSSRKVHLACLRSYSTTARCAIALASACFWPIPQRPWSAFCCLDSSQSRRKTRRLAIPGS